MVEPERIALPGVDEASLVARVTRYSSLRGVERALLPSVRRRVRLPTTHLGADLLARLQSLLDHARAGHSASPESRECVRQELARVDEALSSFAAALSRMIDETPITQLRATLPLLVERSRSEVGALLDLCLESFVPGVGGEPPSRIDYLVTLLARQRLGDLSTLWCDPCNVTAGVRRRCEAQDRTPDDRAPRLARRLRDARIDLLAADDLDDVVGRTRDLKAELGACLFDRDVLRAMVSYNIAAENRFRELFELEHRRDAAIERTLRALSELDMATPGPAAGHAGLGESSPSSPGVRALEEALRDRLVGQDHDADVARRLASCIELLPFDVRDGERAARARDELGDALTRAAVVVGLALRDLPSLTERLRELDIDVSRMKTNWVRELDVALQAAIGALAKSGRPEQAARLAHTRMRYLSSH